MTSENGLSQKFGFWALAVVVVALGILLFNIVQPFLIALFFAAMLALLWRPMFEKVVDWVNGRRRAAAAVTAFTLQVILIPLGGGLALAERRRGPRRSASPRCSGAERRPFCNIIPKTIPVKRPNASCFGVGMAPFGYCPGTRVTACGQGRRDAMVGVLDMLLGAGTDVAFYLRFLRGLKVWSDAGKMTLSEGRGTSPGYGPI